MKGRVEMGKTIKIFDTTLRDGEQSPGCSMNLQEKIQMAKQSSHDKYTLLHT